MKDVSRADRTAQVPAPGRLTPEQLAVVAAGLAEVAGRLDGFRRRLSVLGVAIQASSGSTSRSTRASRSSTRSRSS